MVDKKVYGETAKSTTKKQLKGSTDREILLFSSRPAHGEWKARKEEKSASKRLVECAEH